MGTARGTEGRLIEVVRARNTRTMLKTTHHWNLILIICIYTLIFYLKVNTLLPHYKQLTVNVVIRK
jgi:hypothetical protein